MGGAGLDSTAVFPFEPVIEGELFDRLLGVCGWARGVKESSKSGKSLPSLHEHPPWRHAHSKRERAITNDVDVWSNRHISSTFPFLTYPADPNNPISTVHTTMPLNTLFGENIRSPAPQAEDEEDKINPFDLAFRANPASNSDTSGKSSLQQNDRLTLQLQDSLRLDRSISFSHGDPHVTPSKRKGNPRVLFMGMRRYGHDLHDMCSIVAFSLT